MMMWLSNLALLLSIHANWAHKLRFDHGVNLATTRPLNIGHRGSAGTLPEHTVAGYRQAVEDGADVIECDVLLTKDLQLICLHDPLLSYVTDVADHPEFADRMVVNLTIDRYGPHDDWSCFDFTLAELKTLRVNKRESFRDQKYNGMYEIPSLDEYIRVAKEAGRPVGIYPELKIPETINAMSLMNGQRFEDVLLDALHGHGYTTKRDPCFIQSYSDAGLRYMRPKTELPLVILGEYILGSYVNVSLIQEWGTMYYGFGTWKTQIIDYHNKENGYKNWISGQSDLLKTVQDAGLKVHLYTYRNEDKYLAWDFQQDPINEYLYFFQLGIDGYFTDFPATLTKALNLEYAMAAQDARNSPTCTSDVNWVMQLSVHLITMIFMILSIRMI